jgi:hypothetical protein
MKIVVKHAITNSNFVPLIIIQDNYHRTDGVVESNHYSLFINRLEDFNGQLKRDMITEHTVGIFRVTKIKTDDNK